MLTWFYYVALCGHHHSKRVEWFECLRFWLVLRWLAADLQRVKLVRTDLAWQALGRSRDFTWAVSAKRLSALKFCSFALGCSMNPTRYLLRKSEILYPEKKAVDQQEAQHYSLSCSILAVWRVMLSILTSLRFQRLTPFFRINEEVSIRRSSDSFPCVAKSATKKTRLLGRSGKTWVRRSWVGHSRNALAVSLVHTWVIDVLHHCKYLEGLAGSSVWISYL